MLSGFSSMDNGRIEATSLWPVILSSLTGKATDCRITLASSISVRAELSTQSRAMLATAVHSVDTTLDQLKYSDTEHHHSSEKFGSLLSSASQIT